MSIDPQVPQSGGDGLVELPPILLIVDDDPGVVGLLERLVAPLGFTVVTHSDGAAGLASLGHTKPDAALIDLGLAGIGGLEVLRQIRAAVPSCQVTLMTGGGSIDSAIEAVKLGALDYLTKPLDLDRLRGLLTTVRKNLERRRTLLRADAGLAKQFEFHGMVGRSPVMQELFDSVRRLAPHIRTALVSGETGTGKELVCRALHTLGASRGRPFVAVNCSAIVPTLFESELFGHVRGAFTGATDAKVGLFEQAEGGTLFLDEIGELPLALQPKLLRVIEYGEVQRVGAPSSRRVDVRVVAATNLDLMKEVQAGRFRQDLYYRLNVVEILLPPLRDRLEDISYLTAKFVNDAARRYNKPISGLTVGAERLLRSAPWPGNVRQLRNVIERACMRGNAKLLTEEDVLLALGPARPASSDPMAARAQAEPLNALTIQEALQRCGGNKAAAARSLGVSRRSFYRRLAEFDMT